MLDTLAVMTGTALGLLVGVEFAVAFVINPIMLRLDAGPSIDARAHGGRMLGRAMPFCYIGSTALVIALAVSTWGSTPAVPAVVAAALLVVSVVMSITLLVPINNRGKTWTADHHPADWREQHQRWDRLHYVRVAVLVAALALAMVAITSL